MRCLSGRSRRAGSPGSPDRQPCPNLENTMVMTPGPIPELMTLPSGLIRSWPSRRSQPIAIAVSIGKCPHPHRACTSPCDQKAVVNRIDLDRNERCEHVVIPFVGYHDDRKSRCSPSPSRRHGSRRPHIGLHSHAGRQQQRDGKPSSLRPV